MDYLVSIGGDCEGPDFCRKFGDITIAEGIEKCRTESGFRHNWVTWVLNHSPSKTTSAAVRYELLKLATSPSDDCSIARAKNIYKTQPLLKDEKEIVLKTIFRDDKNRYNGFTEAEIQEGKRLT